jgi:hypothetical protein
MQVVSRSVLVLSALTLNDCSKGPDAEGSPVSRSSDREPVAASVPSEARIGETSKFAPTAPDDPLARATAL